MTNLTRQQREMICASDPDDVSGEEGCGVEIFTGAHYAIAKSLERRGYGNVQGSGGRVPGMYWNNSTGLIARQDILDGEA